LRKYYRTGIAARAGVFRAGGGGAPAGTGRGVGDPGADPGSARSGAALGGTPAVPGPARHGAGRVWCRRALSIIIRYNGAARGCAGPFRAPAPGGAYGTARRAGPQKLKYHRHR